VDGRVKRGHDDEGSWAKDQDDWYENTNAHDPDSKESFCFFFFRKRSSCLLLIHPKPIML
jgi:hypothetical protein